MQIQRSTESSSTLREPPLIARKPTWKVVLGKLAWSKFTYERPAGAPLKLIGSVRKGLQSGALAMTPEGDYVLVVGDHLTPLKTKEIARAVAKAPKETNSVFAKERPLPWQGAITEMPAPAVIVKKRRIAVMP
jgi:hypothetical protein